jgi:hypothetical protein
MLLLKIENNYQSLQHFIRECAGWHLVGIES